jgi:hypothetical protein
MDLAEAQERRGRQIIAALQARAHAQQRGPLGEAEQRTVLETITNLPAGVIDRVVRTDTPVGTSRVGGAVPTVNPAATSASIAHADQAAQPWERDFPVAIQTVVATAASATAEYPAAPAKSPRQRRSQGDRPRP